MIIFLLPSFAYNSKYKRYKRWIDTASAALGMDICALDGVHSEADDKEYIIECLFLAIFVYLFLFHT